MIVYNIEDPTCPGNFIAVKTAKSMEEIKAVYDTLDKDVKWIVISIAPDVYQLAIEYSIRFSCGKRQ